MFQLHCRYINLSNHSHYLSGRLPAKYFQIKKFSNVMSLCISFTPSIDAEEKPFSYMPNSHGNFKNPLQVRHNIENSCSSVWGINTSAPSHNKDAWFSTPGIAPGNSDAWVETILPLLERTFDLSFFTAAFFLWSDLIWEPIMTSGCAIYKIKIQRTGAL